MIANDAMIILPELLLAGLASILLMVGVFRGNQASPSIHRVPET